MSDSDVKDILDHLERGNTMPEEVDVLAKEIVRLRSLLNATSPETLEAIRRETWSAVPKIPTKEMAKSFYSNIDRSFALSWAAAIAAAPKKPEE